jgi:hypothetical protein
MNKGKTRLFRALPALRQRESCSLVLKSGRSKLPRNGGIKSMAADQTERRLTNRVLRVWKALASDGFPSRAQIDPTAFGADWSQCLMIDIAPELRRSRFSYVGSGLRDASWPTFDRQCLAECLDGSLLELVTRHVPRLLQANKPVTTGGQAVHEESNILYRTILLPLSESGHQVDGVLAAVGYREIAATPDIAVDVRPDLTVFEGSETRQ